MTLPRDLPRSDAMPTANITSSAARPARSVGVPRARAPRSVRRSRTERAGVRGPVAADERRERSRTQRPVHGTSGRSSCFL